MKNARHSKLIEYIMKIKKISVEELAAKFSVSPVTIRRDLDYLESTKLFTRVHGGVVANSIEYDEIDYNVRLNTNETEKKRIATKALDFINEGDVIFLDSGTTTIHLVEYLKQIDDLTIVINDFKILDAFKGMKKNKLVFAGGNVIPGFETITCGKPIVDTYKQYYANKALMAVMSVDVKRGLFHSSEEVAMAKKAMIDNAGEVILLVDSTKFDSKSTYRIAELDRVGRIITDQEFDEERHSIPSGIQVIKV